MKNRTSFLPLIIDFLYIAAGVLLTGFALKSFLVPNQFLDGGITGFSLLLHELTHISLGLLIVVVNLPFVIMGIYQVNRKFAVKTLLSIIALAICLHYVQFPILTSDKLLVALFGGFFLGLGIGMAMRGGSAIDGIEVLALYTFKRSGFTISEIILGINVIIFSVAAFHFGLEKAFYAMLTYYTASRTIDYVIEGLEEYTGVTIVSGRSEEVKEKLAIEMGRGITIYKGERGFLKDSYDVSQDCDIIFTVVTRLEVRQLKNVVHSIDPKAFVFTNTIREASGGVLKRKAGEH
jgi:uncharacterized membrane-anchored protein YitT (DUF2179 family)